MAIFEFGYSYERSTVANFFQSISYRKQYFWTAYPKETTKAWNLIYLFTPTAWLFTFFSIFFILVLLKISCKVGTIFGLPTTSEEIVLCPFRY